MQTRELREYAERRGWTVAGEYVDIGISGTKEKRPELDRLMADAHRRRFDVVAVWKFDRMARSVSHLLRVLETFGALDVHFVSLSEAIDTATPAGKMVFTVLGAVAELERSLIVERVRAGLRNARAKGKRLGRPRVAVDTAKIAKIVGHEGEQLGEVYKITVGRDDLNMKEHGAAINARMGLNTWAAFVGTQENAAVAGDIAMLETEVTPVLKALRKNGIDVVAIHHHMTGDRPLVIFLHYWGRGPADKLATSFKAALDELGKGDASQAMAH